MESGFDLMEDKEGWYKKTNLQSRIAYHIMLTRHFDALFFQLMKLPHELPDAQTSTFVGTKYEDIEKSYLNGVMHIYEEFRPLMDFAADKLNDESWREYKQEEVSTMKEARAMVGWLYRLSAACSLLFELEVEETLPNEDEYEIKR